MMPVPKCYWPLGIHAGRCGLFPDAHSMVREELMFVREHINIYKCGENEESLDVDSSFSPLEKSRGQTCLLLFMGG